MCALRDKKINILTLVLSEKKILNETKNHNLPPQVKWSVPNGLLGWTSIEGYIDMNKLLYIGNICRLENQLLPRMIFVTRLLMFNANGQNQKWSDTSIYAYFE